MRYVNKIYLSVIIFLLMVLPISAQTEPPNPDSLSCYSAVLIEPESGEILYEKNGDKKIYPASTTKVVTALLALKNLDLDKSITVPQDFPYVDGSSMYLLPGETFTVREYLEALLVHSANDAAYLLGLEMSGGDINKYIDMMNETVAKLGCTNTHFVNPHGLHDDNHYSTARDMARIACDAMKIEEFRRIVKMPGISLHETAQTPEKRSYYSTNRFLWSNSKIIYKDKYIPIKYDIIEGVKTGYTLEAGNCLISSAYKDGVRLICAVYKASGFEMYKDSRIILDYGFDNYETKKILAKGESIGKKDISFSIQKNLDYAIDTDVYQVIKKGSKLSYEKNTTIDKIKLPIKKGQKIGTIIIKIGDKQTSYDVVALNDVESIFTLTFVKQVLRHLPDYLTLKNIVIAVVTLIILLAIIAKIRRDRIRRRRRRYRKSSSSRLS